MRADCEECAFRWVGPRARAAARRHADKTGHKVHIETVTPASVETE